LIVHSRVSDTVQDWSVDHSAHIFYVASFAATALFEGLGAQGTTILLRSGVSDRDGPCAIHVIARYPDDGCSIAPLTGSKNNTIKNLHLTFQEKKNVFDDLANLI